MVKSCLVKSTSELIGISVDNATIYKAYAVQNLDVITDLKLIKLTCRIESYIEAAPMVN